MLGTLNGGATGGGPAPDEGSGSPGLPGRYEDLGVVACGGFGEVRRVRDTLLDRVLVMKLLHLDASADPFLRRRFFTEIQITAQLQHPGVVPMYDHGELPGGRLWYVMKEVRGTTLREIIDDLHAASTPDAWGTTASGWTFRRAVDALARIAQTVAYAHRCGVMHRDIKPENLMVGELGEAHVMDWGLARRVAGPSEEGKGSSSRLLEEPGAFDLTLSGDILGTPAYMPPEQAAGARDDHGPHSDVYALGAVLYHLLAGRPPYSGQGLDILWQIRRGPPQALRDVARGAPPIPGELARACEQALSRARDARGSAEGLATDMLAWLDGVRRREQATAALEKARELAPEIARLRGRADDALAEARAQLADVKPFDPIEVKRPAWQLEDRAAQLRLEAAIAETRWREAVHAALVLDGELPEAHEVLADYYRQEVLRAERAHHAEDAARFEEMLRSHDRGKHAAFLRGDGALTLVTDPPGAAVTLFRYEPSDRRLCPVLERELGTTPLVRVPVRRGSYLCVLRAPGREEVRYPILVERDDHWDGCAPGEPSPQPIALPPAGGLGPGDVYVPAGWCWTGGDPEAAESLPAQRLWVEGFVIRRFPVTNAEYVEFLNDLVASGREAEAEAAAPRSERSPSGGGERRPVLERDPRGRFILPEGDDPRWQPDLLVAQIDWHAASAFARWLAARTGEPWRLPGEIEREKAARGVDGRLFPWGDHGDATFACVLESHRGLPTPEPPSGHPIDESPYGARGLAGNVRDWCVNRWTPDGPRVTGGRSHVEPASPDDPDFRAVRGGFWNLPIGSGRAASRFGVRPGLGRFSVGLRPARDYPVTKRA